MAVSKSRDIVLHRTVKSIKTKKKTKFSKRLKSDTSLTASIVKQDLNTNCSKQHQSEWDYTKRVHISGVSPLCRTDKTAVE